MIQSKVQFCLWIAVAIHLFILLAHISDEKAFSVLSRAIWAPLYGVERKYQAQNECNAYNGFHLISIRMNEANQIKRFHVLFFLVKFSWDIQWDLIILWNLNAFYSFKLTKSNYKTVLDACLSLEFVLNLVNSKKIFKLFKIRICMTFISRNALFRNLDSNFFLYLNFKSFLCSRDNHPFLFIH